MGQLSSNLTLARSMPAARMGLSFGVKKAMGGHWFEILLTNNNATTVDQYISSTYQGAPLRAGDIMLGFNIERRFGGD